MIRAALHRWLGIEQQAAQVAQLQAQVTALQHQMLTLRAGLSPEQWQSEFDRMPKFLAVIAAPAAPDSGWPSTINTRQFSDA